MKPIAILLSLSIAILFNCCSNEASIKKVVFDKVDLGMTKAEVKRILGEPYEIRYSVDSFEVFFYRVKHKGGDVRNASVESGKDGYVRFFSAGLSS